MTPTTKNYSGCALLFASLFLFSISPVHAQSDRAALKRVALNLPDAPGRDSSSESSSTSSSNSDDDAAAPKGTSSISGIVQDATAALVPGARVILREKNTGRQQILTADSAGAFNFTALPAGTYQVTATFTALGVFVSPDIVLASGQQYTIPQITLPVATKADVEVTVSLQEQAQEQIRVEEKQRAFGIIPNFYVTYDPHFVPLTTKLKYQLALKTATDPVTIGAALFIAGIDQAADTPGYVQGAKGYGQRFGAAYTNGVSEIMIGGAILPSILHQDPRYFYQGTGTKKSRALHAISAPFKTKGDNGKWEFNYSSLGGDLLSASISNAYYPRNDRGPGLVFGNALITTGGRMVNGLAQEFILRKITSKPKD
ncbi:carboxypeptidase-like regulatory domain-containing protein [Granulicella sp. dw_53]|uniref:carboxypeptidase-like regulatory domain-containing protein n=1 Tax=Granulicella sp. dw_53 TaxID=2719792 RepID=UPI001BD33302|nr:carboxypeptidase-like regulatory domain-containing protein [Granulicella sp. dw_53]